MDLQEVKSKTNNNNSNKEKQTNKRMAGKQNCRVSIRTGMPVLIDTLQFCFVDVSLYDKTQRHINPSRR